MLSHVETPVILFLVHYEQNCDISNILKYFRRGAVFLISVRAESNNISNYPLTMFWPAI